MTAPFRLIGAVQPATETITPPLWPFESPTVRVSSTALAEQVSDRFGLWVVAEGLKVLSAPDQVKEV